jgi:hypothetical protein
MSLSVLVIVEIIDFDLVVDFSWLQRLQSPDELAGS